MRIVDLRNKALLDETKDSLDLSFPLRLIRLVRDMHDPQVAAGPRDLAFVFMLAVPLIKAPVVADRFKPRGVVRIKNLEFPVLFDSFANHCHVVPKRLF